MSQSPSTTVIIGAGVVGCAVAQRLSSLGHSVLVLEKNARIADGVTSRNSGVIHAGLYYPPKSLKAESCILGNPKLYEWCEKKGVAHKRTGKWIVGQKDEEAELHEAFENAKISGATGLHWGTREDLQKLEQWGIQAAIGYFSGSTGIVDAYAYSNSFRVAAETAGADFVLGTNVTNIRREGNGYIVESSKGEIPCDVLINAAGLHSDEIHAMLGFPEPKIYPYRGDYFRLRNALSCPYLIYPVKKKNAAGLGVHLTIELDGSCKLGPDVSLAPTKESFGEPINLEEKKALFAKAAGKFLKNISAEDLQYDTCGIRPKLRAPEDKEEKDFLLKEFLPGYIALLGIESPGLTGAIHLADKVADYFR